VLLQKILYSVSIRLPIKLLMIKVNFLPYIVQK